MTALDDFRDPDSVVRTDTGGLRVRFGDALTPCVTTKFASNGSYAKLLTT